MNYLVRSVKAVGRVLGVLFGQGLINPADESAVEYPGLRYYF